MDSFANDYSEKYRAIGSNIRMARNATGISQTELANRVGSGKSAISRYENGAQKPSLETLMRVADALDVDLVDLLKDKVGPSLGKVVSEPELDWMQALNINLTKLSPTARQSFARSVIAMYRGYQEELSEII
ncbi:MAG: helix-turn-helix transcriptional regulator [Lachnospiraceae bacterium]|nr:helix-turn-helix transcriptional regulator [Lachnospiraceae bacterium]